jgi:hypothetical protein
MREACVTGCFRGFTRRRYTSRFEGLPDAHYGNDRHWVCGDMGFSEWTLTGTTPLGERVEVQGTDHLEFRDGKIIRKNSLMNFPLVNGQMKAFWIGFRGAGQIEI